MNTNLAKRRAFLAERKNEGRRITIGFTGVADLRSFIGQEYISGMIKAAEDYDINFINMGSAKNYSVFEDSEFTSYYMKNFAFMKQPLLDGLITWASSLTLFMDTERVIKTFMDLRPLPMVDIGGIDLPGISSVRVDNDTAIGEIVRHLISVHHYTKMAFVGYGNSTPSKRRLESFKRALQENNLPLLPNATYMTKTFSIPHVAEAVNELCSHYDLHDKKEIEVIITTSDILASEIMEQLEKKSIFVPKDIAITGYNNWYEGISARCPMTTISLDSFKRGYTAVELLIDTIMQPNLPVQNVLLPTSLIVRQSCGCLEQPIVRAGEPISADIAAQENSCQSEEALRSVFFKYCNQFSPWLTEKDIDECINSIFLDIYDEDSSGALLSWFRHLLQDVRKDRHFDGDVFENIITQLRLLTLPLVQENAASLVHMENIFHQMRALVSVYLKYEIIQARENPYRMNNLSRIAIHFDEAKTVDEVFGVLRLQLGELGIPWAVLALCDQISYGFSSSHVAFTFPDAVKEKPESPTANPITEPNAEQNALSQKILDVAQFPKEFFPQKKRYSLMLEVLHHGGRFFGYAFLEIKTLNMAVYDVVRMLLSNALDSVYPKHGRNGETSYTITQSQLKNLMPGISQPDQTKRTRISVEQIGRYLTRHLDEMTDVQKMADEFMVSKSYLSKKTKELTGMTLQTLHEKLKIEQAKNMLQLESFELSEIATALGFKNQSYFSNVFKKNTGMSPKNWLKRQN